MVISGFIHQLVLQRRSACPGYQKPKSSFLPQISVGQLDSFLIDQHRLASQPAYAIAVVYKDKTIYRRFNG
ncbi:MAG: hypothetical protein IPH94_20390 [Saprospiraceae bacterium]|nr:hypothetical protein [Saprospiraceae bacterium]